MNPEILEIEEKKFVGICLTMNLLNDQTPKLWKNFRLLQNHIPHIQNKELVSLQVYPQNYFSSFDPAANFQKWALAEVESINNLPENLNSFIIPAGLYAVFHYRGSSATANDFFRYIFTEWMPNSKYELDDRPHFEVLGEKYKNNDPASEEEVFIPIKIKP